MRNWGPKYCQLNENSPVSYSRQNCFHATLYFIAPHFLIGQDLSMLDENFLPRIRTKTARDGICAGMES